MIEEVVLAPFQRVSLVSNHGPSFTRRNRVVLVRDGYASCSQAEESLIGQVSIFCQSCHRNEDPRLKRR
jgi:hypothetical protein